jgi:hypothetical protein
VTWASFSTRFDDLGGGEIPGLSFNAEDTPSYAETGEVETIDGFVICMSPWAVRELRFDESLGQIHGYDFDISLQARAAGKKVVTADLRVVHHHSLDLIGDVEAWIAAHMRVAEKWEGRMPGVGVEGGDWKHRARRAEAKAAAAQLIADLGPTGHGTRAGGQIDSGEQELAMDRAFAQDGSPGQAAGRAPVRVVWAPTGRATA